jgi:hypothetical protein
MSGSAQANEVMSETQVESNPARSRAIAGAKP